MKKLLLALSLSLVGCNYDTVPVNNWEFIPDFSSIFTIKDESGAAISVSLFGSPGVTINYVNTICDDITAKSKTVMTINGTGVKVTNYKGTRENNTVFCFGSIETESANKYILNQLSTTNEIVVEVFGNDPYTISTIGFKDAWEQLINTEDGIEWQKSEADKTAL